MIHHISFLFRRNRRYLSFHLSSCQKRFPSICFFSHPQRWQLLGAQFGMKTGYVRHFHSLWKTHCWWHFAMHRALWFFNSWTTGQQWSHMATAYYCGNWQMQYDWNRHRVLISSQQESESLYLEQTPQPLWKLCGENKGLLHLILFDAHTEQLNTRVTELLMLPTEQTPINKNCVTYWFICFYSLN